MRVGQFESVGQGLFVHIAKRTTFPHQDRIFFMLAMYRPSIFWSVLILRRRKGETVRSFWPLCLCCAPSEDESSFERTFSALKAELAAQNIVEPYQIHMDWTPAGKAAATKVFPKARPRRSLQHLRRNLRRNDSKGKRPPVARKPKKPAQAGKSRGGSGSAGSLKPPKQKLAPHLQTRSIWAS